MTGRTMSESARARTALQWTGTIVLGVYILRRSDLTLVWALLIRALPAFLFIAAGLYAVDRLVAALKWRMLFVAYGSSLRFSSALSIILQSTFLGAAIPGPVGIDVIRARMVSRRGRSFAHSLSSVVVERIMGVVALVLCALLGVGLFAPRSTWILAAPALGLALVGAVVGLALMLIPKTGRSDATKQSTWAARLLGFLGTVHGWLSSYGRLRPLMVAVFLIALGQQYLMTSINWVLASGLGLSVPLTTMLWVWPIVMIAIRLPFSVLGFGVRELVLLELLGRAGVSSEAAVSLGLLSGGYDLLFVALGGALVLVGSNRRLRQVRAPSKTDAL